MSKTDKCRYGFSCASMLMQPGLTAEHCPNREVCGIIRQLTPEEEIEFQQARLQEQQRIVYSTWITRREAALMMLRRRGCPQTLDSLGVNEALASLRENISHLEEVIAPMEESYIAPAQVEVHRYCVKRPSRTFLRNKGVPEHQIRGCQQEFWYNKMTSKEGIFEPIIESDRVKVLHLSHDDSPRNIEARYGIERRNRLASIKTRIEAATALLMEATAMAQTPLNEGMKERNTV